MNNIIEARNVCMDFKIGDGSTVHALKGIDLQIPPNKLSVLRGRSGSGKTTLINILGALDRPTSGEVVFLDRDITKLPDKDRDRLRRVEMAFVFQSVALISTMTAFENVEFALRLTDMPYKERVERAKQSLIQVGLKATLIIARVRCPAVSSREWRSRVRYRIPRRSSSLMSRLLSWIHQLQWR